MEVEKEEEKKDEVVVLEDVSEDEDIVEDAAGEQSVKKKRRKKKKKKKAVAEAPVEGEDGGGNVTIAKEQSDPPEIPIDELFQENFPKGEVTPYEDGYFAKNGSKDEKTSMESLQAGAYEDFRRAAEAHRQVRYWAKRWIQPGMQMFDVAESVESRLRLLIHEQGLESGLAFPTGVSLNHCAAHYTPNKGDSTVLQVDDVMKLDMGLHVNGRIIDSAITLTWNDKYDSLLAASREATNGGVKAAGPDARLGEIGGLIQEIIESHEVEIQPGKISRIRPVSNLTGHSLGPYIIHAGKSVPLVRNGSNRKMEEGEFYAIETFASTGKGVVHEDMECSHYMRDPDAAFAALRGAKARHLLNVIETNFSTLAWCRRWLDRLGEDRYGFALKQLVDAGLVRDYPPLSDVRGSFVSQFEHTLALKPTGKEVFTRGDDF